MFSKKPEERSPAGAPRTMASGSTFSVFGTDVVVKGDVTASADLHVDGTVVGDITCASLVQGEGSTVEGSIKAETARLAGTVKGTITARELVILKSAKIEGEVHRLEAKLQEALRHQLWATVGVMLVSVLAALFLGR